MGHMALNRELVEQRRLSFLLRSHHRQSLPMERIESAVQASIKEEFFNKISLKQLGWQHRKDEGSVLRPYAAMTSKRPQRYMHE